LKIDIDDHPVLTYSFPQIMLLTVDLHGYFINAGGVAIASVFGFSPREPVAFIRIHERILPIRRV